MKLMASYISKDNRTGGSAIKMLTWPDSALIRSGKPVFLDDSKSLMLHPGLGVRIKSVGKSIKSKFAGKYYEEIFPLVFILKRSVSECMDRGEDPVAADLVADYSVIIGDTLKMVPDAVKVINIIMKSLYTEETAYNNIEIIDPVQSIAKAIEEASRENTLKTGDIVGCLLPAIIQADRDRLLVLRVNDSETSIENKLK